jgi:hypothetical protein
MELWDRFEENPLTKRKRAEKTAEELYLEGAA